MEIQLVAQQGSRDTHEASSAPSARPYRQTKILWVADKDHQILPVQTASLKARFGQNTDIVHFSAREDIKDIINFFEKGGFDAAAVSSRLAIADLLAENGITVWRSKMVGDKPKRFVGFELIEKRRADFIPAAR
jgi:hypothetical protein